MLVRVVQSQGRLPSPPSDWSTWSAWRSCATVPTRPPPRRGANGARSAGAGDMLLDRNVVGAEVGLWGPGPAPRPSLVVGGVDRHHPGEREAFGKGRVQQRPANPLTQTGSWRQPHGQSAGSTASTAGSRPLCSTIRCAQRRAWVRVTCRVSWVRCGGTLVRAASLTPLPGPAADFSCQAIAALTDEVDQDGALAAITFVQRVWCPWGNAEGGPCT